MALIPVRAASRCSTKHQCELCHRRCEGERRQRQPPGVREAGVQDSDHRGGRPQLAQEGVEGNTNIPCCSILRMVVSSFWLC